MVHNRIPMERRHSFSLRKKTFRKRQGVLKKRVEEIAVLCDADVVLLLFSPLGNPSLFLGQNSELAKLLDKFSNIDPVERENRKQEVIKKLSKSLEKEGHEIAPELLVPEGHQHIEEYRAHLRQIQEKIDGSNEILRFWNNPYATNDILYITAMEHALQESVEKVQKQKAQILELANPIASEASSSASPISSNNKQLHEIFYGGLFDIIFIPIGSLGEVNEEMVSVSDLYPYSTITSNTISQTREVTSSNSPISADNGQVDNPSFTELLDEVPISTSSLDELNAERTSESNSYTYNTISEIREAWNSWNGPLLEESWWDKVYNYGPSKKST